MMAFVQVCVLWSATVLPEVSPAKTPSEAVLRACRSQLVPVDPREAVADPYEREYEVSFVKDGKFHETVVRVSATAQGPLFLVELQIHDNPRVWLYLGVLRVDAPWIDPIYTLQNGIELSFHNVAPTDSVQCIWTLERGRRKGKTTGIHDAVQDMAEAYARGPSERFGDD